MFNIVKQLIRAKMFLTKSWRELPDKKTLADSLSGVNAFPRWRTEELLPFHGVSAILDMNFWNCLRTLWLSGKHLISVFRWWFETAHLQSRLFVVVLSSVLLLGSKGLYFLIQLWNCHCEFQLHCYFVFTIIEMTNKTVHSLLMLSISPRSRY